MNKIKATNNLKDSMSRKMRNFIAGKFPGFFVKWYSTLDNPMEVPVQKEAYHFVLKNLISGEDGILDVGFGLGYGLKIMAGKNVQLKGIEVDSKAVANATKLITDIVGVVELKKYNGYDIPYNDREFNVVTCVDVIEHVPDYMRLIRELTRVSKRYVFISTPLRRPEYTRSDGRPNNPWHIREWTFAECSAILNRLDAMQIDWNFINGPWEGPFFWSKEVTGDTIAMAPVLLKP